MHKPYTDNSGVVTTDANGNACFTVGKPYTIEIAVQCGVLDESIIVDYNMTITIYTEDEYSSAGKSGVNGVDYLYFGEYPQTLADSFASTSEITGYTATTDFFYGYCKANGQKEPRVVYTKNGETDGSRYVCLTSIWDFSEMEDVSAVNLYKIEPLKWRILNKESDGTTKLLCDTVLEKVYFQQFNNGVYAIDNGVVTQYFANNYCVSTLRNYLVDTFYNGAFSPSEQLLIKKGTVDNSDASIGGNDNSNYSCENTSDKVFALSVADVTKTDYGFISSEDSSDTRKVIASDYAIATGVYSVDGFGNWSLRSPYAGDAGYARLVDSFGFITDDFVSVNRTGCVPALLLCL